MSRRKLIRLKEAVIAEGREYVTVNPMAVTLTCKKARHEPSGVAYLNLYRASENLKHFRKKLNQKLGHRRKTIGFFAVTEKDSSGRYHHHLCIERPEEIDDRYLKFLIWQVWRSTDWGMPVIDVQDGSDPRWISYMCKLRSKEVWDEAIDWINCHRSRLAEI